MQQFQLLSADGKTELACYATETKQPRALLQISHGMCEYFLRYEAFAEYLSERGILVFGHDHLGHGRTAPSEEDLGFTVSGGGADCLVEDVHRLSLHMKERYPDCNILLFGHSMGSFIAREVIARYGTDYASAIICGTGGPDMPAGAGAALARMLMIFGGERSRSKLLKGIAFAGYNKRVEDQKTPMDWLTRDAAVVDRYLKDPYCTFVFTKRAFHDLFTLISWVSHKEWASRVPNTLPILVVSGEADPVGAWGRGVKQVSDRLTAAGKHATLRLYPEMRHEIINEIGRERVWKELEQWVSGFAH